MTIKEQENQLELNLNIEIVMTVIVWLMFVSFLSFRYYKAISNTSTPLTISSNVPAIRIQNINLLKSSLKQIVGSNLPITKIEPFD